MTRFCLKIFLTSPFKDPFKSYPTCKVHLQILFCGEVQCWSLAHWASVGLPALCAAFPAACRSRAVACLASPAFDFTHFQPNSQQRLKSIREFTEPLEGTQRNFKSVNMYLLSNYMFQKLSQKAGKTAKRGMAPDLPSQQSRGGAEQDSNHHTHLYQPGTEPRMSKVTQRGRKPELSMGSGKAA